MLSEQRLDLDKPQYPKATEDSQCPLSPHHCELKMHHLNGCFYENRNSDFFLDADTRLLCVKKHHMPRIANFFSKNKK